MTRQLLPLNGLRAFEAAARHLSFAKAAEELNVTPAAISHQIKALEAFYGVALFRRMTRAILLTDAGQAALPNLREGFDRLAQASETLRAQCAGGTLTISVAPSFGAKWLVPRLDRFHAAHPEIEVRIDANDRLVDMTREGVDLGLRFGRGGYPGMRVDLLFSAERTRTSPVCSPRLLEGSQPLAAPADLRNHTLLHLDWGDTDETAPSWRMWLLAAGLPDVDPTRGPRFSMSTMAIQAAIEGQGVALAEEIIVADDLAKGHLVRPFDLSLSDPMNFAYYVASPEATAGQPKVAAFRDWVLAEARGDQA
ncbi:MAG: transcriptional regulator GcvA [Rhodospirillales bacterium]|nr:transcriptional regulator GcvA [Rhodospirillales bacterium]